MWAYELEHYITVHMRSLCVILRDLRFFRTLCPMPMCSVSAVCIIPVFCVPLSRATAKKKITDEKTNERENEPLNYVNAAVYIVPVKLNKNSIKHFIFSRYVQQHLTSRQDRKNIKIKITLTQPFSMLKIKIKQMARKKCAAF